MNFKIEKGSLKTDSPFYIIFFTFVRNMGTIIIIIVCGIGLKFVYDTYLTNNTEKNWKKFSVQNPNDSLVLKLNQNPNYREIAKLRFDGVYICQDKRYNGMYNIDEIQENERHYWICKMLLKFDEIGNVVMTETVEDNVKNDYSLLKQIIEVTKTMDPNRKYRVYKVEEGIISFSYDGGFESGKIKFIGAILENQLILGSVRDINNSESSDSKLLTRQNLIFDFVNEFEIK